MTGLDDQFDLLRIYKVDFDNKRIKFISESNLPVYMVEDLTWDKGQDILLTTGEQEYFYYEGQVSCD